MDTSHNRIDICVSFATELFELIVQLFRASKSAESPRQMMFRWIAVLCAFFMTSTATSMTEEEIKQDALVRFHWSESNKMRNNTKYGADVRRRAAALDDQLATIMKAPFGPFWSKNPRRIVIQSLDDPDLVLAVKQRNLELVEPIKIHLFHAKNDISTSHDYLEKEKRVLSTNNYTAALLTAHLGAEMDTLQWCIGEYSDLPELRGYLLPILTVEDLRPPQREQTMNRLKNSIKSVLSHVLHLAYHITEGAFVEILNEQEGWGKRFKNIMQIQLRTIIQNNGSYQDMEWLRNDMIDIKWMAQGMHVIYFQIKNRAEMMREEISTIAPMTEEEQHRLPMFSAIHPLIIQSVQDIANQTRERYGSRYQTAVELLLTMSHVTSALPRLREVSTHLAQNVKELQEMGMIRNIGTTMAAVHRFISEGSSIAIVVPGDLVPNVDRLEHLLRRIIKKFRWKRKCVLEISEI